MTFGQKQAQHEFDEGISLDGVFRWQSQPKQKLEDSDIKTLITHDESKNSIYLFLRTSARVSGVPTSYTYMGRLKYLLHDSAREKPVHFSWQLMDWPLPTEVLERIDLQLEGATVTSTIAPKPSSQFELTLTPPPSRTQRKGVPTQLYHRRLKADYSERDAQNRTLGLAGEELVVEYEKQRLRRAGKSDLAERILHVAKVEGDGAGYDIRSYTEDGLEKYIEVKTTRGDAITGFYLSLTEVNFSNLHGEHFYLYRIYDFDESTAKAKLFVQKGNLCSNFQLQPIQFKVDFENKSNSPL